MTLLGTAPADMGDVGAVAREYAALRRSAVIFDRGDRARARLSGSAARETLTGLVTNDVVALATGSGQYAAALTPKGKITADVRIFARADELFVDLAPRAAAGWWGMVRKYVNPRVTRYVDATTDYGTLGVYGVRARELGAAACSLPASQLAALDMYAHLPLGPSDEDGFIARVPELGLEGYDLVLPANAVAMWLDRFRALGAIVGSAATWTVARIEAGRPEWGLDMDDATLAQEANLETLNAISFTKGCYTGQETVARIHFRGHVNRCLRGLAFDVDRIPPPGARLVAADGREVGDVRSVARSPRLGGLAIGMVRQEADIGASLNAVWGSGSTLVAVHELPFPL
ncbi:MAG: CAF17-like 4Fe-4S cluster assembly/insertion protein YgfZ [Gemmatimonadaceae bacterium]